MHELGGGEGLRAGHSELVQPRDARVLQRAVHARGLGQMSSPVGIGDQVGVKPLDSELPLEAGDAEDLGAEDLACGPGAERLGEVVSAESATRGPRALSSHSTDGICQYATLSMNSA